MIKKRILLFLSYTFMTVPLIGADYSPAPAAQAAETPAANSEEVVIFTPPSGWRLADTNALPSSVKVMVIGKGKSPFPPSMNLAMQPYKKSLQQYLKTVKAINASQDAEWKDLGSIQTEAGPASLSQVDRKTEWGEERMMHVILLKNEQIYILTASALKEEFPQFYKDFFAAMKSLRLSKDIFDLIPNTQRRAQLKKAYDNVQSQWLVLLKQQQASQPNQSLEDIKNKLFESESFQNTVWTPFKTMLEQQFSDMGPQWQSFMMEKTEDNLFSTKL